MGSILINLKRSENVAPPMAAAWLLTLRSFLAIVFAAFFTGRASAQLEWDPLGGAAGAQGGSGDWLASNGGNPWWNGTANVNWTDGSNATFGGTAGNVTSAGVVVGDVTFGTAGYNLTGFLFLSDAGTHVISNPQNAAISASVGGLGSFVKMGVGTLTLTGANSYDGSTAINEGTLEVGGGNAIPDASSLTLSESGSLRLLAGETINIINGAGSVVLGANTLRIGGVNGAGVFTGTISGTGGLAKFGTGTLTLTGTNTFTGGITLGFGTLAVSAVESMGANGSITFSGGRLLISGSGSSNRPLVYASSTDAAVIEIASGTTVTLNSASGPGGLAKIGPGTLIQTDPANSFSGNVSIAGGTLKTGPIADAGMPSALGAGNQIHFGSGGELSLPAGVSGATDREIFCGGDGRISINNSSLTLNGNLIGNGSLTLAGTNAPGDTFILNAKYPTGAFARTTGSTIVDRAKLQVTGAGLPPMGRVELVDNTGAWLDLQVAASIGSLQGGGGPNPGRVTVSSGLSIGADNSDANFAGVIEGNAGITVKGSGISSLTGPNTFTGSVVVDGGRLAVADAANSGVPGSLGSGSTVQLGTGNSSLPATLIFLGNGTNTTNRNLLVSGAGGGHVDVPDPNGILVWSGPVDNIGGGDPGGTAITKEGEGTLRLTGSNSYVGSTVIKAGKLEVFGNNALPNLGNVSILAGASLGLLAGSNETIGSLEGAGALLLGGQRLITGGNGSATTFSGLASGGGNSQIEKQGAGTFTLTNAGSSFSGGVTIADGAISTPLLADSGTSSPVGSSGPVSLGDSTHTGRLIVTNTGSVSTNRSFLVSQGGGSIEVSNGGAEVTLTGSISGAASLFKLGSGRLKLSGDKAFAGSMIVANGTLRLDGNTPGTPITVLDQGTLDSSGPVSRTLGTLGVSGGVVSPGLPGAAGAFDTGDVKLGPGLLAIDLLNATAAGFDRLNVAGTVEFTGSVGLLIGLGFDPVDNVDVFRIIANDGSDEPTFDDESSRFIYNGNVLDEGEQFLVNSNTFSQIFEIRYGLSALDNDVRLIAVPETSTAAFLGVGVLAAFLCRNRRKRC